MISSQTRSLLVARGAFEEVVHHNSLTLPIAKAGTDAGVAAPERIVFFPSLEEWMTVVKWMKENHSTIPLGPSYVYEFTSAEEFIAWFERHKAPPETPAMKISQGC